MSRDFPIGGANKDTGRTGMKGGFGLAIPKAAKDPQLAFDFAKFVASKDNAENFITGGGQPSNATLLNSWGEKPEYQVFKSIAQGIANGHHLAAVPGRAGVLPVDHPARRRRRDRRGDAGGGLRTDAGGRDQPCSSGRLSLGCISGRGSIATGDSECELGLSVRSRHDGPGMAGQGRLGAIGYGPGPWSPRRSFFCVAIVIVPMVFLVSTAALPPEPLPGHAAADSSASTISTICSAQSSFTPRSARMLAFAAIALTAEMVLGFLLAAWIFGLRDLPGMGFVRTVLTTPILVAPVVAAVMWRFMYQPDFGIFNTVLTALGLPRVGWLSDPDLALFSVALIDVWQWTPFVFLILLSGMYAIPRNLYEAAELDGAGTLRTLLFITIPLLKRVLSSCCCCGRSTFCALSRPSSRPRRAVPGRRHLHACR